MMPNFTQQTLNSLVVALIKIRKIMHAANRLNRFLPVVLGSSFEQANCDRFQELPFSRAVIGYRQLHASDKPIDIKKSIQFGRFSEFAQLNKIVRYHGRIGDTLSKQLT